MKWFWNQYVIEDEHEDVVHHIVLFHSIHWEKVCLLLKFGKDFGTQILPHTFPKSLVNFSEFSHLNKDSKSRNYWMLHKHFHKQVELKINLENKRLEHQIRDIRESKPSLNCACVCTHVHMCALLVYEKQKCVLHQSLFNKDTETNLEIPSREGMVPVILSHSLLGNELDVPHNLCPTLSPFIKVHWVKQVILQVYLGSQVYWFLSVLGPPT